MEKLDIIGRDVLVDIVNEAKNIPAKVDTGADGSAIWASDIHLDQEGTLVFKLFDKSSPYYTGKTLKYKEYSVARVKSASGHVKIKFKVLFDVKINNRVIKTSFGLSDRSTHHYPILIGRRTLANNFLVDVSKEPIHEKTPVKKSLTLNQELKQDPNVFYKKYFLKED